MRKSFLSGLSVVLVLACCSCHRFHHDADVNITISEDDDVYKMRSSFSKDKTKRIQHYMDMQLGSRSNVSFVNKKMDEMLTMKDQTTFYIKSSPGELEIELDKDKNSDESYAAVKEMCEGVKRVIVKE